MRPIRIAGRNAPSIKAASPYKSCQSAAAPYTGSGKNDFPSHSSGYTTAPPVLRKTRIRQTRCTPCGPLKRRSPQSAVEEKSAGVEGAVDLVSSSDNHERGGVTGSLITKFSRIVPRHGKTLAPCRGPIFHESTLRKTATACWSLAAGISGAVRLARKQQSGLRIDGSARVVPHQRRSPPLA